MSKGKGPFHKVKKDVPALMNLECANVLFATGPQILDDTWYR